MSGISKETPNKEAIDAVAHAVGNITFDDFMKVDIRAGRILTAEAVPKSEKLLKLTVDFGELGTRQVLAGIAKSYSPFTLSNQLAAFVVNLPPRKMMGHESHGMILAVENVEEEGGVSVVFLSQATYAGSRLG